MSINMQEADMEDFMHVVDCAPIPRTITMYLIQDELVDTSAKVPLISTDDIREIHCMYGEKYVEDPEKLHIWSHRTAGRIQYMIKWLNSYHRTYGRAPITQDLEVETFDTLQMRVPQA